LPVYRRQDEGEDMSRNLETFAAARKLLASGGTIGICPEGVSHDEPRLRPIKTGAARIALGAVSTGEVLDLQIVPAGLYYTSKTSFRSSVLLYCGKPFPVPRTQLEPDGNPPRAAVRELSAKIEVALREVLLDAEHEEALHTAARAERIFSAARQDESDDSLTEELQLRQRFVKAYKIPRERAPARLEKLEVRMTRFEEELKQAGMQSRDLAAPSSKRQVLAHLLTRCVLFLLLLGPAVFGVLVHYPAYRFGAFLATQIYRDTEDVVSTVKIISAMLLFPLTWIVLAMVTYKFLGLPAALLALAVMPAAGYVAIRFPEEIDSFLGGLRALVFFLRKRRFFVRLIAERKAIRNEILAHGDEVALATP
jgi:hypothetical protein